MARGTHVRDCSNLSIIPFDRVMSESNLSTMGRDGKLISDRLLCSCVRKLSESIDFGKQYSVMFPVGPLAGTWGLIEHKGESFTYQIEPCF